MESKYSEACKVGGWYTDDPLVMGTVDCLGVAVGQGGLLDFDGGGRVSAAEGELFRAVQEAREDDDTPPRVLEILLDCWAALAALELADEGEDRGEDQPSTGGAETNALRPATDGAAAH